MYFFALSSFAEILICNGSITPVIILPLKAINLQMNPLIPQGRNYTCINLTLVRDQLQICFFLFLILRITRRYNKVVLDVNTFNKSSFSKTH